MDTTRRRFELIIRSLADRVAALDELRELDLLGRGQQRPAAGLVEEQLERVGRRHVQLAVHVRRVARLAAAVVVDLHPVLLELAVEVVHLVAVQLVPVDDLVELGEPDTAQFLAVLDQEGDVFSEHELAFPGAPYV